MPISRASSSISTSRGGAFNPGKSLKNAWTDWNTPDYSINGVGHNDVNWIGTSGITVTSNTPSRAGASATYVLNLNNPQRGDKVTLRYRNQSPSARRCRRRTRRTAEKQ
jgi:hypothetical protein